MQKNKQITWLRPGHIFLACAICLALVFVLIYSQQEKLAEVRAEQERLQAQHDQLLLEEQMLERMIEFANTDDYIEQIAREKLGYVWPNDYKFYRE